MIRIENDILSVGLNLHGGCLSSIVDRRNQEELLYQPVPESWSGQDIVIFPFIARLKDKTYTHKGKEYSLKNHGLARYADFEVAKQSKDSVTLRFVSNEGTLKEYPFPFCLEATYSVKGNVLHVHYEILNTGKETMPFGLGAHPAFRVDVEKKEGEWALEGNTIRFPSPLNLTRMVFEETGSFVVGEEPYGTAQDIPLSREWIRQYKTLALKAEEINEVTLCRKKGREISFRFPKMNYFILWSFPDYGDFVAIEPWMSLPDYDDCPKEIMEKKSLIHLEPGQTYSFEYQVSI